jgi:hypothetical protein
MLSPENLHRSQRQLLESWLHRVDSSCVKPVQNPGGAIELLHQAKITGQALSFVAIGCADWQDWSDGHEKVWHIGKINSDNKRARRFAEEVAQWQNSLSSLGINSVINFSLSNVEILDPIGSNLDSRLDDPEIAAGNVGSSNQEMAHLLRAAGANIRQFDHFQIWQRLAQPTRARNSLEFLDSLIRFDFSVTAPLLVDPNEVGPIWLDIQSFAFKESSHLFRLLASEAAPDLPLITPFRNSGNWHARPETKNTFPDIFELLNREFGFKPAQSQSEWKEKALKIPDSATLAALRALGVTNLVTDDNWEKRKEAIEALALIAFNN